MQDDIQVFIREMEKQNIKKLWLVGGSDLIESFYQQGKIDEFIVTVFPKVLGKGVQLKTLSDALQTGEVTKVDSIDFGSGVFQENYTKKN